MRDFLVYLAGPITGLTYGGATDWREYAKDRLWKVSGGRIEGMSPMRHKENLQKEKRVLDCYESILLSSQRGITARDKYDCIRSDALLVNMNGAEKVSIGTVLEIGWGSVGGYKPIVLVMDEQNHNVHDHAMIRETCPLRVNTLDEGIMTLYKVLIP